MSQIFINEVHKIEEIDNISRFIKRRLKRECEKLQHTFNKIIIEYTINHELLVTLEKKNKKYCFNISLDYPFKAPKLDINGLNQYHFFNLKSIRFINTLKYLTGFECLCCNSVLCPNNWAPNITLEHIINQIEEFKKIKYFICIKIILDKIKNKYLIIDIDLESWLFNYNQFNIYR